MGARLQAPRGGGAVPLKPKTRYFTDPPTETNEAAIETFWNGQLYTVVGKPDGAGGWQLRLWWKPFVTLILLGGVLIAFGGALALFGRLWRPRPGGGNAPAGGHRPDPVLGFVPHSSLANFLFPR